MIMISSFEPKLPTLMLSNTSSENHDDRRRSKDTRKKYGAGITGNTRGDNE